MDGGATVTALDRSAYVLSKTPLAGESLRNIVRLLLDNRFAVDPIYVPRLLYSLVVSAVVAPVRWLENVAFHRIIARTQIEHPPLFILGHWRSGTTLLHNVLSRDRRFGYFTTQQAYFPHTFLAAERLFRPLLAASLPAKRPMDDVAMGPELPQEEEYALGAYSPCAYYHGWVFPRRLAWYERFVCMDSVSPQELAEWHRTYLYLVKKLTHYWRGKPLLLKNPPNTARLDLLRSMFPGAKFVHIHRNPYHVYLSTMKLARTVMPLYCVNEPDFAAIEGSILDMYVKMHRKYFAARENVPKDDLVEVKFEDFIANPLTTLREIYRGLALSDFDGAGSNFSAYLQSLQGMKAAEYQVDDELRRRIPPSWDFVFEHWGYSR